MAPQPTSSPSPATSTPPVRPQPHRSTSEMPPGRLAVIAGFVVAGAAMWIFPPVLFVGGMVLAAVAWRRGDPLAKWVALAVFVGALMGQVINWLPEDFVTS